MKMENEIPKHRKKKESSTSKSKYKAKHKHKYVECLLISEQYNRPYRAEYCTICGKIGDFKFFESVADGTSGFKRMLNADEIFERYENLEQIQVADIWQKYVPISKEDKK